MKNYSIHHHPTQGYQAVKIGFSWPAFFFGWFWMLFKQLWGIAMLWFVLTIVAVMFESIEAQAQSGFLGIILVISYLALWLIPALSGNDWRRNNLAHRGYLHLANVQENSPEAAIANHVRQEQVKRPTS